MKKSTVCAIAMALVSVSVGIAKANVEFGWTGASGSAKDATGTTLSGTGWLELLYVSTDTTVNWDRTLQLQSTYGDDKFIGIAKTSQPGRITDSATATGPLGLAGTGPGSYVGLYTYMILVDQQYAAGLTPESISVGMTYGVSSIGQIGGVPTVLAQQDQAIPPTPQAFSDAVGTIQTSVVNVPEPSAIALMLAGLGIIAMRMRRK